MARNQPSNNSNNGTFAFLNRMGSKLGTILSLCTLGTVISGVSAYATTIVKNIEILDLKKEFSLKEIEYKSKISDLEYEIKINKVKLEEYEKRRK